MFEAFANDNRFHQIMNHVYLAVSPFIFSLYPFLSRLDPALIRVPVVAVSRLFPLFPAVSRSCSSSHRTPKL